MDVPTLIAPTGCPIPIRLRSGRADWAPFSRSQVMTFS